MATVTFDIASFRALFPAFGAVSDATVTQWWDVGNYYLENNDLVLGDSLAFALNAICAHLTYLATKTNAGKPIPGVVSVANIEKVHAQITVAPFTTQWQWWLSLSPYGTQLWALLQVRCAGGFYFGASLDRAAFRGADGAF